MAQTLYRANLSAKTFPLISDQWGQTVIIQQYDNTFNRQVASQDDVDKDVGIPQVYYCHNVMPNQQGLQSIGYRTIIPRASDISVKAKTILLLRNGAGDSVYCLITKTGKAYVQQFGDWVQILDFGTAQLTTTYVEGISYVYAANKGCYRYDFGVQAFIPVTLTGLDPLKIEGICAANGYMLAWSSNAISWSSTIDPTDFTPSLTTGSGGGNVESLKGTITTVVPNVQGFIVYSTHNLVAAKYSGNTRYPYNFNEIVNSGGLLNSDNAINDTDSSNQYAYTTSGLQQIASSQSQSAFPAVTDFIAGGLLEEFSEDTDSFTYTKLQLPMTKSLAIVADRYLVISYGNGKLDYALVYDTAQRRFGKLKISHVKCFEYKFNSVGIQELPRQSIAFLQEDGTIKIVDFSLQSTESSGVIVLGKYQLARSRLLQMDEIRIENIPEGATTSVRLLSTTDGKNYVVSSPTLGKSVGEFRRYYTRAVGVNHSLVIAGAFNLTSLEFAFHLHGKR